MFTQQQGFQLDQLCKQLNIRLQKHKVTGEINVSNSFGVSIVFVFEDLVHMSYEQLVEMLTKHATLEQCV